MKKTAWITLICSVPTALPVFAVCPSADLTGDCFVDLTDLVVMVEDWLVERTKCPPADRNGDCHVDLDDFVWTAKQWLTGDRLPEDMVSIPAGTFQMGNSKSGDEGSSAHELPVHTVTLDSFAIGKYEITNQQYCNFLNSALQLGWITVTDGVVYVAGMGTSIPCCTTSSASHGIPNWGEYCHIAYNGSGFSVLTKNNRSMANDPMVQVSWYGAAFYCNWRSQQEGRQSCYTNPQTMVCDFSKNGYHLPTEAQWEYAARGCLEGNRFPWGDTISHSQANYYSARLEVYDISETVYFHPTWDDGYMPYTSPVGSFVPNGFGLYDMAGNAREWCNDWYSDTYYSISPTKNPTGPTYGLARVHRGGSWYFFASRICRVTDRANNGPNLRDYPFGFRVAFDLK